MKIITKELTPERWEDLELLFGERGACGGCWCMSWRIAKGEKWDDIKGKKAKSRQKKLVKDKKSFGILAYVNGEVITIDGGEWLKGAGQMNLLEEVPEQMWDMLEMMIRSKKNK